MKELLLLIVMALIPVTTMGFMGCGGDDNKTEDTAVETTDASASDSGDETSDDSGAASDDTGDAGVEDDSGDAAESDAADAVDDSEAETETEGEAGSVPDAGTESDQFTKVFGSFQNRPFAPVAQMDRATAF